MLCSYANGTNLCISKQILINGFVYFADFDSSTDRSLLAQDGNNSLQDSPGKIIRINKYYHAIVYKLRTFSSNFFSIFRIY